MFFLTFVHLYLHWNWVLHYSCSWSCATLGKTLSQHLLLLINYILEKTNPQYTTDCYLVHIEQYKRHVICSHYDRKIHW